MYAQKNLVQGVSDWINDNIYGDKNSLVRARRFHSVDDNPVGIEALDQN